jgi:cation-transporting ATPase 13A3/4/5
LDDTPATDPTVQISENTVLAMTGEVWRNLIAKNPKTAVALGKKTLVFGRCTPVDKVSIVSTFVRYGDITMMCGDGGNDSGALKAAHVGVALSDSEASVVAPFTSLDKTITSVLEVLREGRCALSSSFSSYKYMLMYGQVETFNQVANAYFNTTFGEWCWLFLDGIWPITMAFSLPLSRAAKKLSKKHPTASILSPHTLFSACGVLAINVLFLVISLVMLFNQDWFQCRMWDGDNMRDFFVGDNYETSTIFVVTGYQYISSAAAFNFGYTWRRSWWRNYVFVFFFLLWTIMHFVATLHPSEFSCIFRLNCTNENVVRSVTFSEPQPINNNFNTTLMPTSFRIALVILMIANLISVCGWEYFIVNGSLSQALASKVTRRKVGNAIDEELRSSQMATKAIDSMRHDMESGEVLTSQLESDQSDSKKAESDESDLGQA